MRVIMPTKVARVEFPFRPLLESWERSDHPAQFALRRYREELRKLVRPSLSGLRQPLALGLHVGGRSDLAAGCDLDNFLTPVVKALGGGEAFSFVWAVRGAAEDRAALTLAPAGASGSMPPAPPLCGGR